MKYFYYEERENDSVFIADDYPTIKEAVAAAERAWNYLTDREKSSVIVSAVMESANPDEDADDHLDGNPVYINKWVDRFGVEMDTGFQPGYDGKM